MLLTLPGLSWLITVINSAPSCWAAVSTPLSAITYQPILTQELIIIVLNIKMMYILYFEYTVQYKYRIEVR